MLVAERWASFERQAKKTQLIVCFCLWLRILAFPNGCWEGNIKMFPYGSAPLTIPLKYSHSDWWTWRLLQCLRIMWGALKTEYEVFAVINPKFSKDGRFSSSMGVTHIRKKKHVWFEKAWSTVKQLVFRKEYVLEKFSSRENF